MTSPLREINELAPIARAFQHAADAIATLTHERDHLLDVLANITECEDLDSAIILAQEALRETQTTETP